MTLRMTVALLILAVALGHVGEAAGPTWKKDATEEKIPSALATGMAHGVRFQVENASIQNGILTLRQGKDFFANQEFMVFTFLKPSEPLDGKTLLVKPNDGLGVPHIHFRYRIADQGVPEIEIFMKNYTMKVEFGAASDHKIPGKIYLCLPDREKSFVAGAFEADVK